MQVIDKTCRTRQKTVSMSDAKFFPTSMCWYILANGQVTGRYGPYNESFMRDVPVYDQDIQVTRDVPRRYSEKVLRLVNPPIRLWPYLPFAVSKSSRRVSYSPGWNYGSTLPCQLAGTSDYRFALCTQANEWQSRYPLYPTRDVCISRFPNYPGNTYEQTIALRSVSDFSAFLEWCSSLNLSGLVGNMINNLGSTLSNYPDLLVVFGELREVGDLFKAPKSVADAHLQNTFGIKPTISSIRDISEAVKHRYNDAFKLRKMVAKIRTMPISSVLSDSGKCTSNSCYGSGAPCYMQNASDKIERFEEGYVTLELLYKFDAPSWGIDLLDRLDLFLTRMNMVGDASTIWELTRLSWLLDWFIPVGTMAAAASIGTKTGKWKSLSILDGSITFTRKRTDTLFGGWRPCMYGRGCLVHEVVDEYRVPLTTPYDWLHWSIDVSSRSLNMSQLLTIAALVSK